MITRCKNGHYYDNNRYVTCPHCGVDFNSFAANLKNKNDADDKTIPLNKSLDDAETVGLLNDDSATVSYFMEHFSAEPVVGWLVCVGGKELGRDYRLKPGRNTIGRAHGNDIVLRIDANVARQSHASIIYDRKSNCTFISGDNSTDTLVDGAVLTNPVEIKDRAKITIGETEFVFVAFCCGEQRWEATLPNNK